MAVSDDLINNLNHNQTIEYCMIQYRFHILLSFLFSVSCVNKSSTFWLQVIIALMRWKMLFKIGLTVVILVAVVLFYLNNFIESNDSTKEKLAQLVQIEKDQDFIKKDVWEKSKQLDKENLDRIPRDDEIALTNKENLKPEDDRYFKEEVTKEKIKSKLQQHGSDQGNVFKKPDKIDKEQFVKSSDSEIVMNKNTEERRPQNIDPNVVNHRSEEKSNEKINRGSINHATDEKTLQPLQFRYWCYLYGL